MTAAPRIDCDKLHPGIPVANVARAVAFYRDKLGFTVGFTWPETGEPTMAGMNLGDVQVFLEQRRPAGEINVYFVVGDVETLYAFHRASGVEIYEPIADREYGLRDYGAKDIDGTRLTFGQYIYTVGEPIPIERVDVPVRLEKRLAALLEDLARHKRLSVAGVLEEMILHTNDGVGPHTESQLRHIQELKAKHGIDYDTHGSYRFQERR